MLLVLSRLAQRNGETRWLKEAFSGWTDQLAELAVRLVIETSDPLDPRDPVGRVLTAMFQQHDPPENLALKLYEAIPPESIALTELGVLVTNRLLRQELAAPTPDLFRIGSLQNDLGFRQAAAGRITEAAAMAEDAVRSLRQLVLIRPEARGRLAMVLANLAQARADVGDFPGAFAAADEAVAIAGVVHTADPASAETRAGRAQCLMIQAETLGNAAKPGALAAAQEAVPLLQALVAEDRRRFGGQYVTALQILAKQHGKLGHHEEEHAAAAEAAEYLEDRSLATPDSHLPALAAAQNILATSLRALGRYEPAIEAHLKAIRNLHILACQRPDVFDPHLAGNLNGLADCYRLVDQQDEAVAAAREATDLFAKLARRNHGAFAIFEARSANTLSAMCWKAKQFDLARASSERAVAIYRALVARQPEFLTHELAGVLINLGIALTELGEHEQADSALREALQVYREHAKTGMLDHAFAAAMTTHSTILERLGNHAEALRVQKNVVAVLRRLSSTSPEAHQSELANALFLLGIRYDELRAWPQAGKAISEAVHVVTTAPGRTGDVFGPIIANYRDWIDQVARSPIEPGEARERSRVVRRGERLLSRVAKDPRAAAVLRGLAVALGATPTSAWVV